MPNIIIAIPIPCIIFIFSFKKTILKITTKTKQKRVINAVIVVEESARRGIFKRALLTATKDILATRAKIIDAINLQSIKIEIILLNSKILPEIKSRCPSKTIEKAVVIE